jgi:putative tryptophan/tyrosine transport system substrate-binding protein
MAIDIARRKFIAALSGTAFALPLAARAQQTAAPVIGFLGGGSPDLVPDRLREFRRGLGESGYVEGQNVTIEYLWADGHYDRLPELAADLVRRQVSVIAALGSTAAALAAQGATTTIPIVFNIAGDPIELGLVRGLARPGGNITGVATLGTAVGPKRLELVHELVPAAMIVAGLVNPNSPLAETQSRGFQEAAHTLGLEMRLLNASTDRDLDTAFASLVQLRAGALVIGNDALFTSRTEQLASLATRYAVPTVYQYRQFTTAGGLMSYGNSPTETSRVAGLLIGSILKGEKPADLPVQQPTKVELIINLKTAKTLGITVPLSLLGRADEVIE